MASITVNSMENFHLLILIGWTAPLSAMKRNKKPFPFMASESRGLTARPVRLKMKRFKYLINKVEEAYPQDQWIKDFRFFDFENDECFLPTIDKYEDALGVLSEKSWSLIEIKTIESFKQNIKRRGKQAFFNHLNEALAYKFLKDFGFDKIEFIPENKKKTPDIEFYEGDIKYYCEVKTIGVSEQQLNIESGDCYQTNDNTEYEYLGKPFFHKLKSTIDKAIMQMPSNSKKNIVFIVIKFDDFTNWFWLNYKNQIIEFLEKNYSNISVHIRSNVFERSSINHGFCLSG